MFKKLSSLIRIGLRNYNSSPTQSLIVTKYETVLHLKLNRPHQCNSLNYELINKLIHELIEFENDRTLKSVVVTGSDGNFCCGLDRDEIEKKETLIALSNLIQLFPLTKPSIVGVEGYATCVGLQLALAFDYKIVENDSKLQINLKEHLPFHPYIKQLYSKDPIDLVKLFNEPNKANLFIKDLVNQHKIITKNCQTGCCFGVALELGKCIEKFSIESITYDRNKLIKINHQNLTDENSLFEILNNKDLYTRSSRFLNENIGRHGATNIDTLDEIYQRWAPKLVLENEL